MIALLLAAYVAMPRATFALTLHWRSAAVRSDLSRAQLRQIDHLIEALIDWLAPPNRFKFRRALESVAQKSEAPNRNDTVWSRDTKKIPRSISTFADVFNDQVARALRAHRDGDVDAYRGYVKEALKILIKAQLTMGAVEPSALELAVAKADIARWIGTVLMSGAVVGALVMGPENPRALLLFGSAAAAIWTVTNGPQVLDALAPRLSYVIANQRASENLQQLFWREVEHSLGSMPEWNDPLRVEPGDSYPWAPNWTHNRAFSRKVIRFLLSLRTDLAPQVCSDLLVSM